MLNVEAGSKSYEKEIKRLKARVKALEEESAAEINIELDEEAVKQGVSAQINANFKFQL